MRIGRLWLLLLRLEVVDLAIARVAGECTHHSA